MRRSHGILVRAICGGKHSKTQPQPSIYCAESSALTVTYNTCMSMMSFAGGVDMAVANGAIIHYAMMWRAAKITHWAAWMTRARKSLASVLGAY